MKIGYGLGATLVLFAGLFASPSLAKPVEHTRTDVNVDWISAGVTGTGNPGYGDIVVAGVNGNPVLAAFLYWHGIGNPSYDNATVKINGNPVTGVNIGDSTTNCWGAGSSTAYRADVSAFVAGDGTYSITELSSGAIGNSSNGASLVVTFDDGNPSNNKDLAVFEGNDSDTTGYPGETSGWHATLAPINYGGGAVGIEFHVADGQNAGDGPVSLDTSTVPPLVIADDATLWDGVSLPSSGNGRNGHGLWDIHYFDMTSAFPGTSQIVSLDVDGQDSGGDCLGLVLALVELEPFSAPPPAQAINLSPRQALDCTSDPHEVLATVRDDTGAPVATTVNFTVISGPGVGNADSVATDANGEARFVYTSAAAGNDLIEGCFVDDQQIQKCDTVRKTWEVCNTPPDCSQAIPTMECLWPPNHSHENISIAGVVDEDGDQISIAFVGATSDEATSTEKGSGGQHHSPDVIIDAIAFPGMAAVRAERSGLGDGRVYELSFVADDGNGGQCVGAVKVQVPHHLEKKICNSVDSGQNYDATVPN